jgi:uncharacterized LabA/DUF88 family protein
MSAARVSAFVDGFNLYHAIKDTGREHLKWLDLWALCQEFSPRPDFDLRSVYYFSALATWRPGSCRRHREYVAALRATGVTPVMARFKKKERKCKRCGNVWLDHEEKETDVGIALRLVVDAIEDRYDRAVLVSADSDLVPAVRTLREVAPGKAIRIVFPLGRNPSGDLARAAGGSRRCRQMRLVHVERNLLPESLHDAHGSRIARRPAEYAPPASPQGPAY